MIGTLAACTPPVLLVLSPLWVILTHPGLMLGLSALLFAMVCPAHQFHWLERLFIKIGRPLPRALDAVIGWRDSHVVVRTGAHTGYLTRAMLWGAAVTAVFTALASALVLANYYTGWPSL